MRGKSMKDYQKAMLYVYPRIGKIIRDIDGMVEAQAFCCFGTESCEKTAERIAGYICAKSSFVILKDALENILSRLTKDERYMLEYKYFCAAANWKGNSAAMRSTATSAPISAVRRGFRKN